MGEVIIEPSLGYSGETRFIIETGKWVDNLEDFPLRYCNLCLLFYF